MLVPGRKGLIRILLLASIILMVDPISSSVYPFGSKVLLGDSDIGMPLYRLPAETNIAFWDIGTPGYDVDDPVYLHISYSTSCTTNANDVRLSFLANVSPGSKVRFNDSDMNKPLTRLPSIICFLNENGSQAYDLNDPVYLHHITYRDYSRHCDHPDLADHPCCDNPDNSEDMTAGFFERIPYRGEEFPSHGLSYALFTDNYKLFISDKLIDKRPRKVGEMRGLCIEMIQGLKADYYHVLGTWLIKIKAHKNEDECSRRDGKCDDNFTMNVMTNAITNVMTNAMTNVMTSVTVNVMTNAITNVMTNAMTNVMANLPAAEKKCLGTSLSKPMT
ncbi:MAG: hypothetical protein E4G89_05310 [Methanothrix sp.]|nr:MAG: hypothetical protein E4G89_05310 [Methanothrix sp.]